MTNIITNIRLVNKNINYHRVTNLQRKISVDNIYIMHVELII